MTWVAIAVAAVVLVAGLVLLRAGGRNSGAPRARDVGPVDPADPGAHGARTQHQGNIYGAGGGGLPF